MIIETKFSIGDVVYFATTTTEVKQHDCPDCLGTRKWKAVSPAGLEYEFPCPRCTGHYRSERRLTLQYTQFAPAVRPLTIGSVQANTYADDGNRYMAQETGVGSGSLYYERDLFATEAEALQAATLKAAEANAGGVPWVKQQYDATLEVCDYQLADGRAHLEKKDLTVLCWRFDDLLNDLEACESMAELKELIEREKSK